MPLDDLKVHILISGPSCKGHSRCNKNASKLADCITTGIHESGETWQGAVDAAMDLMKPDIVIVEQVIGFRYPEGKIRQKRNLTPC